MKKHLFVVISVLFLSSGVLAQDRHIPRFEVGVILGEPLGISAKWWHSPVRAWDLAAAWSFTEDGLFEIHSDYLFHLIYPGLDSGELPIYTGLGVSLRIGNEWFIGPRLPVGVEYIFERLPFAAFAEVVPQWQLLPDYKFVLSGGIGFRLALGKV
ncbi:MAG: hypothetical protein ACOCW2_01180 [Chitinivibrionales bacterium]